MTDFGQSLLTDISGTLARKMTKDTKIRNLGRKIRDGTDYQLANDYAVRAGELLSQSIMENTTTLPYMSEEVAREVIPPLLTANHDIVVTAVKTIQQNINKDAGIGLKALTADLDTNRIEGLIQKVASYETFDEARWVLNEPVINYAMSVVDQTIRKNFDASTKAGLRAKIVRKCEPHETVTRNRIIKGKSYSYTYEVPCQWCQDLEGEYDYQEVKKTGSDVFRRHDGCRCTVEYIQGDRAQDVWSKAEWEDGDTEDRRRSIQQKLEELAREKSEQAYNREQRLSAIETLQRELGYSPKGASILYNKYKDQVREKGLEWLIETTRATNPYARQH